jgi:hypothetical protein
MSKIDIKIDDMFIDAKKLTKHASKIESIIDYVNSNLTKKEKNLLTFQAKIAKDVSTIIYLNFSMGDNSETISIHYPEKEEVLNKAREVIEKVQDYRSIAVIHRKIKEIVGRWNMGLEVTWLNPKEAILMFNRDTLKFTITDDQL